MAGAMPPTVMSLVALVRDGTDVTQRLRAVDVLRSLARNDANRASIIAPLVALVRDGTAEQRANAVSALGILARHDANRAAIADAGGIAPLVALVRDGTDEQRANAAGALRNLAYDNDANRASIIAQLVALSRSSSPCSRRSPRSRPLRSLRQRSRSSLPGSKEWTAAACVGNASPTSASSWLR